MSSIALAFELLKLIPAFISAGMTWWKLAHRNIQKPEIQNAPAVVAVAKGIPASVVEKTTITRPKPVALPTFSPPVTKSENRPSMAAAPEDPLMGEINKTVDSADFKRIEEGE